MTNRIDHTNCDHDRTSAARAICRKARATQVDAKAKAIAELLKVLDEGYTPRPNHWVFYGASHFAQVEVDTPEEAADALLAHFAPSGDEATDARRRANGYIITTDAHEIRRIILRAAS